MTTPLAVGFSLDAAPVVAAPGPPAVRDAVAAVRDAGGRVLAETGTVEGLRRDGCTVLVGDHARDVERARAAGATSVSVLTGGCGRDELLAAGTDVVLDDLGQFRGWLSGHLLDTRLAALQRDLEDRGSVLVAYSGGADSALLLAAAVRALGPDRVAAATGYSHSLPQSERDPARRFAESLGVRVLTPETREMDRAGYRANAGDRCFFCKAELLDVLTPLARDLGLAHVATGTNADDVVAGFRPGIRAAAERGAITPLADAGLTKAQVRAASRRWELPTWDKPQAACLSSRIAYGVEVTPHRLARVERAEAAVRAWCAGRGVPLRDLRVRDLGDRASLEVDAQLLPLDPDVERDLLAEVAAAGFAHADLDPRGFRSGSLNDHLAESSQTHT